ncbi:hypothetical protein P7C71_g5703, partial [Lecanoromycetidae sp. Uapishka_2]
MTQYHTPPTAPFPPPRVHADMASLGERFERMEVGSGFAGHNKHNVVYTEQPHRDRPVLVHNHSSSNGPVTYEEYTFTKEPAQYPGQKEIWARSRKTLIPTKPSELAEQVRKQSKPPSQQLRAPEMKGNKRLQVEELLKSRMARDDPTFHYVLASLKRDTRGKNEETSAMHVIVKRQLRPEFRFNPSMNYSLPPPNMVSEVVDLEALRRPQRPAQGGFKGPHQGLPTQGAFFPGQVHQPQVHQTPLQQSHPHQSHPHQSQPHQSHPQQPRNNGGHPGVQIFQDRLPPKQQGAPNGGQQHHGEPKGPHVFPGRGSDEHVHRDRGMKGDDKSKKGNDPNIFPIGPHGSQTNRPHSPGDSSFFDEVIEICSEDEGLFDRKNKSKKVHDSHKKGSKPSSHKHDKKKGGSHESSPSWDNLEDDSDDFDIDHRKKQSKDHKSKHSKTDSHKSHKKHRSSSVSSAPSDNSDASSRFSADTFPTSVSSGGRSSKKDREYFIDTRNHRAGSHTHESRPKSYRQHERDARQYKPRDLSPVSSGRTIHPYHADEDIIITPGNGSRRFRDSRSSYSGQRPSHRRGQSYDDNVSIDYDQRSATSGRRGPAYPKKISNRAFNADRYSHESDSEDEELIVRRLVNKALEKKEKEARIQERVWDEVKRQEERKMIQESVWKERATARMPKVYYDDEEPLQREYVPQPQRRPNVFFNDRDERPREGMGREPMFPSRGAPGPRYGDRYI